MSADYDQDVANEQEAIEEQEGIEMGASEVKVKRTVKQLDDEGKVVSGGGSHEYTAIFTHDYPTPGSPEMLARFENEGAYNGFIAKAYKNKLMQTAGSFILQHGSHEGAEITGLQEYMDAHKFGASKSGGTGRRMVRKVETAEAKEAYDAAGFTPEQLAFMAQHMNLTVEVSDEEVAAEEAA